MTTTSERLPLGSDLAPAGVTNVLGARPGTDAMHGYDGPQHRLQTLIAISFETDAQALQDVVVPPPLELDPDVPPICTLMAFTSPHFRGRDGRVTPYTGFAFFAPVRYKDLRSRSGWEFIDGAFHDKTVAEIMIFSGQVYGMLKKFGDIRFTINGREISDLSVVEEGDLVTVTVDRKHQRVASLSLRVAAGHAVEPNAPSLPDGRVGTLAVREIPTVDYKGYVDRSVVASNSPAHGPSKVWDVEDVDLTFGATELEALDRLRVGNIVHANVSLLDETPKEIISEMYVVDQLPLEI